MGKFLKEFRAFAMKGNVIDLAIGVIIGSAFGKIVTSLVNDIITPLLSLLIGKGNFKDLSYELVPNVKLNYGNFIQSIIDFLIVAFSIFIAVKAINKVKNRFEKQKEAEPAGPPVPTKTEALLEEIRDILKK